MTIKVEFCYKSKHIPTINQNNQVVAQPALPGSAGLYVIRHKDQPQRVYAGTSSNIQQRFGGRLEVYRESGLTLLALARLRFYVIKLKINDQSRTVNDLGKVQTPSGELDVENLFIRSLVAKKINGQVFNVAKWQTFQNPFNEQLQVEFDGFPHSTDYFMPNDFNMNAWAII